MSTTDAATLRAAFGGERVLVTGHTGFKGSWLAFWLSELGADVTGYALAPAYENSHFEGLGLESRIDHIEADIRDAARLDSVIKTVQPRYVFHLAAQALVRNSYEDPKGTFDTNTGGIVNILESLRFSSSVKAAVIITSDKCYLNKEWVWGYRENDRLGGHDPYSASKAAAEMVYQAYQASFLSGRSDLGVATARAGNVIGGGDWAECRIMPDCIRALKAGVPIDIRNPAATRPWQHVLEPLSGYLSLALALRDAPARFAGSWNFGPEVESVCTVEDLARRAVAHWGSGEVRITPDPDQPFEHGLLQLNIDKAKLELGWRPRWRAARAITETVAWYKQVDEGADAVDLGRRQIADYLEGET